MNILEEIVAHKREAVEIQKEKVPEKDLLKHLSGALALPKFQKAISKKGIHLIAEVKKASPSVGLIRQDFDAVAIARAYKQGGAACLSVLTEEKYFQGSLSFLKEIKKAVRLPILRKDFIIDKYQIFESKVHGADAILLIASILDADTIKDFLKIAKGKKLDVIVEVHDEQQLNVAIDSGAKIIGINTRNLVDFTVDFDVASRILARNIPGLLFIFESGIKDIVDLAMVKNSGVSSVLVGEALLKAEDIAGKTREFVFSLK